MKKIRADLEVASVAAYIMVVLQTTAQSQLASYRFGMYQPAAAYIRKQVLNARP